MQRKYARRLTGIIALFQFLVDNFMYVSALEKGMELPLLVCVFVPYKCKSVSMQEMNIMPIPRTGMI